MSNQIVKKVLQAVAVAMGVAVITLNVIGSLATDTAIILLGVGLTALAISSINE